VPRIGRPVAEEHVEPHEVAGSRDPWNCCESRENHKICITVRIGFAVKSGAKRGWQGEKNRLKGSTRSLEKTNGLEKLKKSQKFASTFRSMFAPQKKA